MKKPKVTRFGQKVMVILVIDDVEVYANNQNGILMFCKPVWMTDKLYMDWYKENYKLIERLRLWRTEVEDIMVGIVEKAEALD